MEDINREKHRDPKRDNNESAKDLRADAEGRLVESSALGGQEPSVVGVAPPEGDLGGVEGPRAPAPAAAPGERQGADAGDGDKGHQGGDEGVGGLLFFCWCFHCF